VIALGSAGCSSESAAPPTCTGTVQQPIVNGTSEAPIPLSRAQLATVGALENPNGELVCSGLLIDERWVLTAGHCGRDGARLGLIFRTGDEGTPARVPVSGYFPHPELDAILLELPPSAAVRSLEVELLNFDDDLDDRVVPGRLLTLTGYGNDEQGTSGARRFVTEPVVEIDATFVTVDGEGARGACNGDSGGPLLDVRPDGAVVVGLLSEGAASCLGRDRYLRVDRLRAWIESVQLLRRANPCGDLTWEGICHEGQLPTWCATDHAITQVCGPDELCGWSAEQLGYRCVDEGRDPCRGAGPSGTCDGNVLLECVRGVLQTTDCGECDRVCRIDANGRARCST
jgi:hypothetical protein